MSATDMDSKVWGRVKALTCRRSEVVCWSFNSNNFFKQQLLGSTPTLITVPHGLAWCVRNNGFPTKTACYAFRWGFP